MQKKKKEGHEQDARGHGILTLQKIKEKKGEMNTESIK